MTIEVLAVPERSEQSLRRLITSVVRAELGSDSGGATVKVVLAGHPSRTGDCARRKLSSLITRRTHDRFSTQVLLSRSGDVATGEAECLASKNQARAVAQAVIDGLKDVTDRSLQIEDVETVYAGQRTLALVTVRLGERFLIGSAEMHFDLPDAVARATLHALNRSLDHAS